MLNRRSERATAAEARVAAVVEGVEGGRVVALECDLADFASVRRAAVELRARFQHTGVDVLCNNAGVMALKVGWYRLNRWNPW